jgi:hypothetical protein
MPVISENQPPVSRNGQAAGTAALVLAGLGFVLPVSLYLLAERQIHTANYLAWEEGIGFEVFVGCVVLALLAELSALAFARASRGARVGKIAMVGALLVLTLITGLVALLLVHG